MLQSILPLRPRSMAATLLGTALLSAGIGFGLTQERAKKKEKPKWEPTVQALNAAWAQKHYGTALENLRNLEKLILIERRTALRAALPAAPEGYEIQPHKDPDPFAQTAAANAVMMAAAMGAGNQIEQVYKPAEGRNTMRVTLHSDSPMIGMMQMWLANPAAMDENSELITYGKHKAILKKTGSQLQLQIVLLEKHLCEVDLRGNDEDFLFKVWDQAAVDRLVAALKD